MTLVRPANAKGAMTGAAKGALVGIGDAPGDAREHLSSDLKPGWTRAG